MTTELFLTQIVPDLRHSGVHGDLRDVGKLHRRIMKLFPADLGDQARLQAAVLFRIEETRSGTGILVQSNLKPDLERLPDTYGTARSKTLSPLLESLRNGATVNYRITANATSKLGKNTTAGRPKQIVPLTGPDADDWWRRQAEAAGLVLHSLTSTPLDSATGNRQGGRMTHVRTRFDGTATITDHQALLTRIRSGIGRGKAFGCGLLTVAPAR
ncbi:type I-E CRISPR-associated protein Cas6/Cse3/CasE [Actinomadura parmotrematis]|uniref:Type I-E CRISPR-associated protein Cas6/Cse3/CasE n=1 Tax=Actinomadura parmotrematis TaxID=2864039 RepID=A0ABS7FVJ6_9ACTN|nr:type I-E CRISPR-associated protein Cas6/Cse3/CasE [Actinomadura parmotrematis]MBW8484438.1 type I-E CRISPR-associated protein Cas6/Cse3/CasE [Actinomadura parmotrematis]